MKRGYKEMVDEAYAEVTTLSTADAVKLTNDANVVFVDVRDVRELEREGLVPGSFHAPRGMLEFWIDPDSPYHKPVFAEKKQFVFYCAAGWRSALSSPATAGPSCSTTLVTSSPAPPSARREPSRAR